MVGDVVILRKNCWVFRYARNEEFRGCLSEKLIRGRGAVFARRVSPGLVVMERLDPTVANATAEAIAMFDDVERFQFFHDVVGVVGRDGVHFGAQMRHQQRSTLGT